MICPYCASSTKVTNSRPRSKGLQVWRRRECKKCSNIWTTHEVINPETSHTVTYDKKPSQPLSRDKLFISLMSAVSHRKSALEDSTGLTDTIITKVLALRMANIPSAKIGDLVYRTLRNYDKTAAAVYKASRRP